MEQIKLLGITIDSKLTFKDRVADISRKVTNIYKLIAKISWGLDPEITRTMYTAIIEPVTLYAASVWYALYVDKVSVGKKLNALQRGFAQKIARSYRTVSLSAATLLAGLFSLD